MFVIAAGYAEVVAVHAKKAMVLYKTKTEMLRQYSGLQIAEDGSNNAHSREDVMRYLQALEKVGGPVAVISARMVMKQAAIANGLDPNF